MASKHAHNDVSIRMTEQIRFIDKEDKQRTGETVTDWHIGRMADVRPLDLLPVTEQNHSKHPEMYKTATNAAIERGAYVTVNKNGDVYRLATNADGHPIPLTLTCAQVARKMCDAMADGAAQWLDGSGIVGYRVKFQPIINWSASSTGAKLADAPTRKNRTRKNDAQANARKQARKQARARK